MENATQDQQMVELPPYRVEIKENSKGEPAISVRATGDDLKAAIAVVDTAWEMYRVARAKL